jgi:beta-glucanase (GH16 family)
MPTARYVVASVCAIGAAAAAASLAAFQTPPPVSTPPSYPGYALVWADEFDRTGEPDPKHWTYERGFVRNRELQWYQPQNARQADGLLVIEASRERVANPDYQAGASDWRRSPSLRSTHRRA